MKVINPNYGVITKNRKIKVVSKPRKRVLTMKVINPNCGVITKNINIKVVSKPNKGC